MANCRKGAKLIILLGAPERDDLGPFSDESIQDFVPEIRRYLGEEVEEAPPSTIPQTCWRSIQQHLHRNQSERWMYSQPHVPSVALTGTQIFSHPTLPAADSSFLSLSNETESSFDSSAVDEATEFIERSFIIHEAPPSSPQLPANAYSSSSPVSAAPSLALAPLSLPTTLRPLSTLPNAHHLSLLAPHVPTVNVTAGVLRVSSRSVTIRRTGQVMQIVELLVGDETRSPFNVTVWLPPLSGPGQQKRGNLPESAFERGAEPPEAALSALRPGSVVLFRHLALASYNSRVYGQSRRWKTNIRILGKGERVNGTQEAVRRVELVRTWVASFVAPDGVVEHSQDSPIRPGKRTWDNRGAGENGACEGEQACRKMKKWADREILDLPPDTQ